VVKRLLASLRLGGHTSMPIMAVEWQTGSFSLSSLKAEACDRPYDTDA
jgi:hypothetical protein